MRISLLGQPGSGKTTLGQLMSNMFNCMYISSGALAREHGFAGSDAEKSGQLDPDEHKIRELVTNAVGDSNHYILDGFPRTIDQVQNVQIPIDVVLHLKLDDPMIGVERLMARGRPDDKLDIIELRMATYLRYTDPLIRYYTIINKLVPIMADGTIAETLGRAISALSNVGVIEVKEYADKLTRPIRQNKSDSN